MENNLISIQFTSEELTKFDDAVKTIESVLNGKMYNLIPTERRQLGSIAERNKLLVNKAKEYMEQYPQYIPTFLDKAEFDKDFEACNIINGWLIRLTGLMEQLSDTKILLDNDNYMNALTFYRNIRFLSRENVPGTTSIAKDLAQFFTRERSKNDNPSTEVQGESSGSQPQSPDLEP